jgi:urease subunit beta
MIPGEYRVLGGEIQLNVGRRTVEVLVTNRGDRPIQVGSHYCFFEVNRALDFDREAAFAMRLDIPAGTAVRFEPGEEKPVRLVEIGGTKKVFGLNNLTQGATTLDDARRRLEEWQALGDS